jgi:SulP family sulfate permease
MPIISGFTYGSGCLIVASQVADLLGISYSPAENYFGPRLLRAAQNVGNANGVSMAIGLLSLLVLLYAKDVRVRGYALPKLTPVPLVVLIAMCFASYYLDLNGAYKVKIVGNIPSTLPPFKLPFDGPTPGADFALVLPSAILMAVVAYVQHFSICSTFARRRQEPIDANRELLALALANTGGGLFSSVMISASFSRTGVAVEAGVASPAANILVGCLMIVAITTLTPFLRFLPMSCLAAVELQLKIQVHALSPLLSRCN